MGSDSRDDPALDATHAAGPTAPAADTTLAATQGADPTFAATPGADPTLAATLGTISPALDATRASGGATAGGTPLDLPRDDRYEIAGEVGRGGIGRVLRARDRILERPVALKELFATDEGAQRRFVREALITARLQHPAIVPVYDAGRRGDRSPYYAMKLVSGRPLDRAIVEANTLVQRLALVPAVLAVSDAVAYAHGHRIIHRDLKPANVLIGEFGETIVIDWGLAKDLAIDDRDAVELGPYRDQPHDATVEGALMGTPAYMAPEQARGDEVDERADVYALGAMLYHVVSGAAPHEGRTLDDMLDRVVAGEIRAIEDRTPEVPRDLAAIVGKAMALEPAARYPSARELADDLRRFLAGQLVGARRYSLSQRLRRWLARHRAIATVVVAAVIVLSGFGVWSVRRIVHERDTAVSQANRAILAQARARLDDDPPAGLALLRQLDVDGPGWAAARSLTQAGLAYPTLERILDGMPENLFEITPDGRLAISFGPHAIWIGELATGRTRVVPVHVFDPVAGRSLIACDDGKRALAIAGYVDTQVITLDLTTNTATETMVPDGSVDSLRAACVGKPAVPDNALGAWATPDHTRVVVLERGGTLRRLDRDGHELGSIVGDAAQSEINIRAWMSRDGEVVVTTAAGIATYWDFAQARQFRAHAAVTSSVAVAADGSHAWAVGRDMPWSVARGATGARRDDDMPGGELEVSPDGAWLIGLDLDDHTVVIDELAAGTKTTLRGVVGARILANGRLVTSGKDGRLRIWHLEPRARAYDAPIWGVAFSPRGAQIASIHPDSLSRGDPSAAGHRERGPLSHIRGVIAPAIAVNDGGDVAAKFDDRIVGWMHGAAPRELGNHPIGRTLGVAIRRDGTPISWSSGALVVWTGPSPRTIAIPDTNVGFDQQLVLDEAGDHALVRCAQAGTERRCLVDIASGRVDVLANTTGDVAAISADGTRALVASQDGGYLVWDVASRTSRAVASDRDSKLAGLSRDGALAVVGGPDDAELLDLERGTAITLRGHHINGPIVFSPDRRAFLDASGTLVDIESGEARHGPTGGFIDLALRDNAMLFATMTGLVILPDELPRDPTSLAARLAALPYELDVRDAVVVRTDR